MLHCWSANPESRPLFSDLEKRIGKLLEKGVAEHYLDLNEPYLQMNADQFTGGQTDYLAFMASPEEAAPRPPVPTYVNGLVAMANAPSPPNYLKMSPKRSEGGQSPDFQFPSLDSPPLAGSLNVTPNSKSRVRKPGIPEEIPMLKRSNQSISTDSETEITPDAQSSARQFENVRPQPREREFKKAEDYVNVPSTIINMNPNDVVNNPGYVMVGNVNETRT